MIRRFGEEKKGFLADIIAVDNNIEQDIRSIQNIYFVMKGGKKFINKIF